MIIGLMWMIIFTGFDFLRNLFSEWFAYSGTGPDSDPERAAKGKTKTLIEGSALIVMIIAINLLTK